MTMERYLTLDEVARLHPVSRSTRWRMIKSGEFPEPTRISPGRIAWKESEISEWLRSPASAGKPA